MVEIRAMVSVLGRHSRTDHSVISWVVEKKLRARRDPSGFE